MVKVSRRLVRWLNKQLGKACVECGKETGLSLRAGRVLCSRCFAQLPRVQCSAEKRSGPFPGRRCSKDSLNGGPLCPAHRRVSAQVLAWERCPRCSWWRTFGGDCGHCAYRRENERRVS